MRRTAKSPYIILTLVLLIISQALTSVLGQFVTDVLTNFILIISIMLFDTIPCVILSILYLVISRICGFIVMPISFLSIIAITNIVIIAIFTVAFTVFASRSSYQMVFTWGVSVIISGLLKFLILYLVIGKWLLNSLQIDYTITYSFGSIQFWSIVVAGLLSSLFVKPLKRSIGF